jgi:hypothetical protein
LFIKRQGISKALFAKQIKRLLDLVMAILLQICQNNVCIACTQNFGSESINFKTKPNVCPGVLHVYVVV